ncbi:MAG: hypothetical protein AAGJ37_10365, partial [Pseudomonadota bacterium]
MKTSSNIFRTFVLVFFLALNSLPAFAYIGPGAGIGGIVVLVALVVGILMLGVGLIYFPLKRR